MRKLHCSVFIVCSIGALIPQAHSLFAAKPQNILTFLTKFSALGHHQGNVQHKKEKKKNEDYIQPVTCITSETFCTCYANSRKRGLL